MLEVVENMVHGKEKKNVGKSEKKSDEDVSHIEEVADDTCHEEGMMREEERTEVSSKEFATDGKDDFLACLLMIEEEWVMKLVGAGRIEEQEVVANKKVEDVVVNFDVAAANEDEVRKFYDVTLVLD